MKTISPTDAMLAMSAYNRQDSYTTPETAYYLNDLTRYLVAYVIKAQVTDELYDKIRKLIGETI